MYLLVALFFSSVVRLAAQDLPAELWPAYGRDPGGSRFSPLTQINTTNISRLKLAWTFRTGDATNQSPAATRAAFEATPIFVDETWFLSTPFNRVLALGAGGALKWSYDPQIVLTQRFSEVTSRGVSTWFSNGERRIFLGTIDARLIALDARTGQLCPDFGVNGSVDLTRGVRLASRSDYQVTSPPAIIDNLVVIGSSIGDNRGVKLERGLIRAFDARTGELRWWWDPIPADPSDPAWETWTNNSAIQTGAANAWSIISADPARHLVFIPTSSPSPDFYGGERLGHNLYANSVVALDSHTGKPRWHFQAIHHDVWDYDMAAQPMLIELTHEGSKLPAVVIGTKSGLLFVLHRDTGKPIFPIEERPAPKSTVPGEVTAATQPFPKSFPSILPEKFEPWGPTPDELLAARNRVKNLRHEGPYTPPSLEGSLLYPGNVGGFHWGGLCYDRNRGLIIGNLNNLPTVATLYPREEHTKLRLSPDANNRLSGETGAQLGTPYVVQREILVTSAKLPLNPPPWGILAAVNLTTSSPALHWRVPLGYMPHLEKYPAYKSWGSANLGGAIVTAGGLVFVAATFDNHLRAFDSNTGAELWKYELPASAQATPMTCQQNGKQYVVICAGGHGKLGTKLGDYVLAFALD